MAHIIALPFAPLVDRKQLPYLRWQESPNLRMQIPPFLFCSSAVICVIWAILEFLGSSDRMMVIRSAGAYCRRKFSLVLSVCFSIKLHIIATLEEKIFIHT
jgi:hypothetical protein